MMNSWTSPLISVLMLLAACSGGGGGSPPDDGAAESETGAASSLFLPRGPEKADLSSRAAEILTLARAQPGVVRAELTQLQAPSQVASMLAKDGEDTIAIDAFGESILLQRVRTDESARGTTEWIGRVVSVAGKPATGSGIISTATDGVTGTVFIGGREIGFNSVGDDTAIIREIDSSRLPPDERPGFTDPIRNQPEQGGQDIAAAGPTEISLLVPVSEKAKIGILAAGYTTIDLFVEAAIGRAHLSFANSKIDIKFVPAKVYLLPNYTESGNWDTDRDGFFGNTSAAAERKRLKADISVLIFHNSGACGEVKDIKATAATSLAVVHWSCAVGNLSFAHELGHLFGAEHDEAHASTPPAYTYGLGYFHMDSNDASKSWRTVMTYPAACGGCDRIPYWSSPLIKYPPGGPNDLPMGTAAKNDNARVLRQRAPTMAGFGDAL
jgi:hypothetical protein